MRQPIALRADYDAALLRRIARESEDPDQVRRLMALAMIYDGARRTQAAGAGCVTLQVVRDWVLRFNAAGPAGLIDRKAPGHPSWLNDEHRAALAAVVERGPIPAVHGVVRWRVIDLCQWLWDEHQVTVAKQTLSRELRAARPVCKRFLWSDLVSMRQRIRPVSIALAKMEIRASRSS
jgi:transposase